MSMVLTDTTRSARRPNPMYASALARYVQKRRSEKGMTIAEAARLSGMEAAEWTAVEAGWIPDDDSVLDAIAEALQTEEAPLAIVAMIGRCNQFLVA